jgi:hypothetical protein
MANRYGARDFFVFAGGLVPDPVRALKGCSDTFDGG